LPIPDQTIANILIVDDYPSNLLALEAVLEPLGQRVVAARSGNEALRHLLEEEFAVVLLDVKMSDIDGFETARLMRQRERTRTVPIIFITGYTTEPSEIMRGYAQGAVDYLIKPYDPAILRSKVSVFVDLFLLREQVRRLSAVEAARVEAERQQENQQHWLQASLDLMPAPLVLIEPRTARILFTNKEANRLAGGSLAKTLSDGSYHCTDAHGERISSDRLPWVCAANGEQLRDFDLAWHQDDRTIPLQASTFTLPAMFGHPTTVLMALHDVTALKRAHQERERLREMFVGMLGHDLRGPLSAIGIGTSLLLKRPAELPERAHTIVARMAQSAERMQRMVSHLLDLTRSRLSQGIPIAPVATDLGDICKGAIAELELSHLGRSVELLTDGDLLGLWDPDRLTEVVQNLIGNALQHSPETAVIRVNVRSAGRQVVLEVHNEGEPIAAELLPQIFEPFRQGAERSDGGLGLGLYIVRQIIARHGGTVSVRSNADEGTRFTVELPREGERLAFNS
jgi:signal transduction histidine kinase